MSSVCADPSTASAFASDTFSVSASAVRFWKSALSSATFASSPESSRWHWASRSFDELSSASSAAFSCIIGPTFLRTTAYSRFAFTHAAKGAAATETR